MTFFLLEDKTLENDKHMSLKHFPIRKSHMDEKLITEVYRE